MTTRTYDVVTPTETIRLETDFAFNNDGHLVFRRGERGATEVVAEFAPGGWLSYRLVDGKPPKPKKD